MSDTTRPPGPLGEPADSPSSDRRESPSGIPLPPFFDLTAETVPPRENPGEPPFTRGIHASMYRGRLWTMRQYSGFGDARETNRRLRFLLEQGQTGLSIAFDLPTQIGYDSDDSAALGEVGKVGVPISTLDDLDELLDGISLERVSISMTINSPAAVLLAFLVALARRRGLEPSVLRGTVQNDILKEFVARHTQRFPLVPSLRLVIDVLEYTVDCLPRWNPISVSGYHMREAGATAVEEVAFTLAHAIAYLEAARDRGLDPRRILPRFSFFFAAQMNLLEEVAKFRGARQLWADIVRERFGVEDPLAGRLRFHTQTAGAALTYQEEQNNVARVTIQALAAVLGGTQSLHTNAADEALGLPTETSVLTALRTQQIIAHESGLADVVDPLGGAACVEHLTDEIVDRASEILREIDSRGGPLVAVEEGVVQRRIEDSAYRHQLALERGERVMVGVNRFREDSGPGAHEVFRVDPELERRRIAVLGERKAARSAREMAQIGKSLEALKGSARSSENLMERLVDSARSGASLGEVMGALGDVFGEYQGEL